VLTNAFPLHSEADTLPGNLHPSDPGLTERADDPIEE
jgi:hypothetical protein